jgi:hypothetical protein
MSAFPSGALYALLELSQATCEELLFPPLALLSRFVDLNKVDMFVDLSAMFYHNQDC